jgi:DNA-binding GntR family transcriptional regulator
VSSESIRDGQNVVVVHELLREAILRGDIAPGQTTSQVLLAKQLGVGRTPLREALRMLQGEGLVLAEPNRRIRIADFSIADVEQVYAMRVALEAVAIRATVPLLRPEDFAELEGLMAQMDHYMRADDTERMAAPHAAFHARFVTGAGPRIAATVAQLFDHAERYRVAYGVVYPGRWPQRRQEHRAMFEAAVAGDVAATVEQLVAHYGHTATLVISKLDPEHEPSLLRAAIAAVAPGALAATGPDCATSGRTRRQASGRRPR